MKWLLVIVSMFFAGTAAAQSRYESGMAKGFKQLQAVKSTANMDSTAALFERIAEAEKVKWLPYYYAAYANNLTGFLKSRADKDKIAEKTIYLIDKAEALEPNNSELFCLRQMAAILQLTVDPMSRWQTYSAKAASELDKATRADPGNPRIYLLQGQTLMNTPEAFGGGNAVAKQFFEKSVALYKTFKPASLLHPTWGKELAEKLLAACQ